MRPKFTSITAKKASDIANRKRWGIPGVRPFTRAEIAKRWHTRNSDKVKRARSKWLNATGREYNRKWQANKRKTDPNYLIRNRVCARLWRALKRKSNRKSSKTEILLGCTVAQFKEYFQSLFLPGMSWDLVFTGAIQIDHKVPCAKFDLSRSEDQLTCFHYTNLQPLWKADNLSKGVK